MPPKTTKEARSYSVGRAAPRIADTTMRRQDEAPSMFLAGTSVKAHKLESVPNVQGPFPRTRKASAVPLERGSKVSVKPQRSKIGVPFEPSALSGTGKLFPRIKDARAQTEVDASFERSALNDPSLLLKPSASRAPKVLPKLKDVRVQTEADDRSLEQSFSALDTSFVLPKASGQRGSKLRPLRDSKPPGSSLLLDNFPNKKLTKPEPPRRAGPPYVRGRKGSFVEKLGREIALGGSNAEPEELPPSKLVGSKKLLESNLLRSKPHAAELRDARGRSPTKEVVGPLSRARSNSTAHGLWFKPQASDSKPEGKPQEAPAKKQRARANSVIVPGPRRPSGPWDGWDIMRSNHLATDGAIEPLRKKWRSAPEKADPSQATELGAVVKHLSDDNRFFSHELPSRYLDHAISQGGIQSGYEVTKALGLPEPRHDKGSSAAGFVFTRQLPPKGIKTTVSQGQVGAKSDAMIVLHPSMFGDSNQMGYFKNFDGAHHSDAIMPHRLLKGRHMRQASDALANASAPSRDSELHANAEQAVYGQVPLRHVAMIGLKLGENEDARAGERKKAAFIQHLHDTKLSQTLPSKEQRRVIKNAKDPQGALTNWQQGEGATTLYQHLDRLLNEGLDLEDERRRKVEDIIHALPANMKRSEVVKKTMPHLIKTG